LPCSCQSAFLGGAWRGRRGAREGSGSPPPNACVFLIANKAPPPRRGRRSPTSASVAPPHWGRVRSTLDSSPSPGWGVPRDCRAKRVGVLSRPKRVRCTWGLRNPCRSNATASRKCLLGSLITLLRGPHATASRAYLLRSSIKPLSSSSSDREFTVPLTYKSCQKPPPCPCITRQRVGFPLKIFD
jgi:hypothetical protein